MKNLFQKRRFSGIQALTGITVSFLLSFCSSAPPSSPLPEPKEKITHSQPQSKSQSQSQASTVPEAPVADNAVPVFTITEEDRLLMEAELKKLVKSERRWDYSGDAAFANFREVKLGSMDSKILYRSCHPALGDARSPYAARLAEQARVGSIVDLSDSPEEMALKADVIPWYQSFITHGNSIAVAMDLNYDSQYNRIKIQEVLRFMLSHKKPFLLHSVDGTDRTAFVVVVLAALMDASREEIIGDYMQSYVNYYGFDKTEDRYRLISYLGEDMLALVAVENTSPALGLRQRAENYLLEKIRLRPGEIAGLRRLLAGQQP
jgi:hypothetical protein